jgi:hypothetical protein
MILNQIFMPLGIYPCLITVTLAEAFEGEFVFVSPLDTGLGAENALKGAPVGRGRRPAAIIEAGSVATTILAGAPGKTGG